MDNKQTTLTRQQLYEQVWSTPMRRLAKRYNLSDTRARTRVPASSLRR